MKTTANPRYCNGALLRTVLVVSTLSVGLLLSSAVAYAQTRPQTVWMEGGHSDSISFVAVSPTGQYFVSCSDDRTLKLWDAQSNTLVRTFHDPSNFHPTAAFSPNGRFLAIPYYQERVVRIVRVPDGLVVRTLSGALGPVAHVVYSPAGDLLACGAPNGAIWLWRISDGAVVSRANHGTILTSLVFSGDGRFLISAGQDSSIRIWSVPNLQAAGSFTSETNYVYALAASPDGQQVAACDDNSIKVWSLSDRQLTRTFPTPFDRAAALSFSPDGQFLASGHLNANRVWHIPSGVLAREIRLTGAETRALSFFPDGQTLLSGGNDSTLRLWRWNEETNARRIGGHSAPLTATLFSPDGQYIASSDSDSVICLRRADTGDLIRCTRALDEYTTAHLAFSPDGQLLAAVSELPGFRNRIRIVRVSDGATVFLIEPPTSRILSAAFSPDGMYLAAGDDKDGLYIWRLEDGALVWSAPRRDDFLISSWKPIAFSPDGQLLATGRVGSLEVWRLPEGTLMYRKSAHVNLLYTLAFSPDGQLLATGGGDNAVRIWRASDGTLLNTLRAQLTGAVTTLAFSPNGRYLLSGGNHLDRTLRFWSVRQGTLRQTYTQETGVSLISVSFALTGEVFAYGRYDASIIVARNPFYTAPIAGDINRDDCVDDLDLLRVLFAFGAANANLPEDINGDGAVDDADLLVVLSNFGQGCE